MRKHILLINEWYLLKDPHEYFDLDRYRERYGVVDIWESKLKPYWQNYIMGGNIGLSSVYHWNAKPITLGTVATRHGFMEDHALEFDTQEDRTVFLLRWS